MSHQDELIRVLLEERRAITAYARSIVFDSELAEDVYQNVAIVALRKVDQINDTAGLLSWLLTITRFEALSEARKRKSAPRLFGDDVLDVLDDSWEKHLENARSGRVDQALEHCLSRLTDRDRELLRLRYSAGLRGADLARAINRSLNTCAVALSRVHRKLRTCMQAYLARTT